MCERELSGEFVRRSTSNPVHFLPLDAFNTDFLEIHGSTTIMSFIVVLLLLYCSVLIGTSDGWPSPMYLTCCRGRPNTRKDPSIASETRGGRVPEWLATHLMIMIMSLRC